MTESKVPGSENEWKSIDIFIFSNGQQCSPPRKYNLMTQQLDWWNNTLNFLAKAQYGSLHNMIDLYTTEGKRVENALQLSNNVAYVAVLPPDKFIDAGYDKYLIKATRSWEKGQVRRYSNTTVVQSEEPQTLGNKSNSDIRVSGSPHIKEITEGSVLLETILPSTLDDQASVIRKIEPIAVEHINNNTTSLNSAKQSDRTNRPSLQRPGTVKKNNSPPSPQRTRKPSIKKRDSVKINTDTMKNQTSISCADNKKVVPRSKIYKPLNKKRDSLPEAVLSKVEEVVKEIKSSSSLKIVNHTNLSTKTENVVRGNDQGNDLYQNPYSEIYSTGVNTDISLSNNIIRQEALHELFDENHQCVGNQYDQIENVVDGVTAKSPTDKINANDLPVLFIGKGLFSPPASSKVAKPESNVAAINKEGTVNLKLNIEIWNDPNQSNFLPNTEYRKESLINIKEKGSQVNIEEKTLQHHKQLHKTIANEMGNYYEGNHNVITVKRSCLNHGCNSTTNSTVPNISGNSSFLIFLPILKFNEECKSCECKDEHKRSNASIQNSSIDKLVKVSSLSIHKDKVEKIVSHEITSRHNSAVIKIEANTLHDNDQLTMGNQKSVVIMEDEIIFPQVHKPTKVLVEEFAKVTLNPQDRPVHIVLKNESTGILHQAANKFTQTEWCDVLVEVRVQNDGHYSFHMPTLEMLKYYKQ